MCNQILKQSYLQVNENWAIKRKCVTSPTPIEKCHLSVVYPSDKVKQYLQPDCMLYQCYSQCKWAIHPLEKMFTNLTTLHESIYSTSTFRAKKMNRDIALSQTATEINEMSVQTSFRAEGSVTQEKVMSHDCTTSAGLLPLRAPSLMNSLH